MVGAGPEVALPELPAVLPAIDLLALVALALALAVADGPLVLELVEEEGLKKSSQMAMDITTS